MPSRFAFLLFWAILLLSTIGWTDQSQQDDVVSGKVISQRISLYYSFQKYPQIAKLIEDAIPKPPVEDSEKSSPQDLAQLFHVDLAKTRSDLKASLLKRGYSDEDANNISSGTYTAEAVDYFKKIENEVTLAPGDFKKVLATTTLKDFADSLKPIIEACDDFSAKHSRGAQMNNYICREPTTSCSNNPRRMQLTIDRNAKNLNIKAVDLWVHLKSLLKDKKNQQSLRNMWDGIQTSARNNTLKSDTGSLAVFSLLQQQGVIPGNMVTSLIMKSFRMNLDADKEDLQAVRQQMDQLALLLRSLAKNPIDQKLFQDVINRGEYYSRCEETLNFSDEPSFSFLLRKEVLLAALTVDKEIRECYPRQEGSVGSFAEEAQRQTLQKLKDIGLKSLLGKESGLLSEVWKDLPPDVRASFRSILKARATADGRGAMVYAARVTQETENGARFQKAAQIVSDDYLDPEWIEKIFDAEELEKQDSEKFKDQPWNAGLSRKLSEKKKGDQSDLSFVVSYGAPKFKMNSGTQILKMDLEGDSKGIALVEYELPDGTKDTVSVPYEHGRMYMESKE